MLIYFYTVMTASGEQGIQSTDPSVTTVPVPDCWVGEQSLDRRPSYQIPVPVCGCRIGCRWPYYDKIIPSNDNHTTFFPSQDGHGPIHINRPLCHPPHDVSSMTEPQAFHLLNGQLRCIAPAANYNNGGGLGVPWHRFPVDA